MRDLTIAAISTTSTGGRSLLLRDAAGVQYRLPIDDRLHAVVRGEDPSGQLRLTREELTPRQIQARVRSGASIAELSESAGMAPDKIEPYAVPVLAERAHLAGRAAQAYVRVPDDPEAQPLGLVLERATGAKAEDVEWDAWRRDDGRWVVASRWSDGDTTRAALWLTDSGPRSAIPHDDEARALLDPASAAAGRARKGGPPPRASRLKVLTGGGASTPAGTPAEGVTESEPAHDRAVDDLFSDAAGAGGGAGSPAETQPTNDGEPDALGSEDPTGPIPPLGRHPAGRRRPPTATAPATPSVDAQQAEPSPQVSTPPRSHVPTWDEIMFGRRVD